MTQIDFCFLNGLGDASYSSTEQKAFENGVFQAVEYFKRMYVIRARGEKT